MALIEDITEKAMFFGKHSAYYVKAAAERGRVEVIKKKYLLMSMMLAGQCVRAGGRELLMGVNPKPGSGEQCCEAEMNWFQQGGSRRRRRQGLKTSGLERQTSAAAASKVGPAPSHPGKIALPGGIPWYFCSADGRRQVRLPDRHLPPVW